MEKEQRKMEKTVAFDQDYVSFTFLCFAKSNIKKYKIDDKKLSKLIFQSYLMYGFQFTLVVCICNELLNSEKVMPDVHDPSLFFAKFVTSIAMHLSIYQEFTNG